MKKRLIVLLAVLMLCGCGKQAEPAQPIAEEPETIHTPVENEAKVEEPAKAEEPEQEPVEIPVEVEAPEKPDPMEIPAEEFPLEWESIHVTGLIEDTVAYDLEQLTFSEIPGAETINDFYARLVAQLEDHTRENIYPTVMEQHTGANVYGEMAAISWNDQWVEVEYTYRVEYLNGADPEQFDRTDRFDAATGETIAAEQ